ncbi:carbohydrate ABC transporter permease [Halomonas sp. McH1-25]|uniref:carbohydrate ABC transporter permease n=1 Tax=unclassified Halomonas TaxID=2609666 RepID=UPI001EF521A2|nr:MULTISPECIES: carbohydrate ABC transporter permease [unclassified Halomonas]MCG7601266.1 carbohydrate ABC transporter permease [Halomonas sp. McH1-25]MCP1343283.1 carbohydrate ABC transporter permease [Halomonas sp. FL8]MCP1360726.1 carbohydrate ABC transporter permease [Halomonas sp. BBD45]MCP1365922.1 carbohydrate ABC transporter permease [Halomonas sp. BBD48]
MTTVKTGQVPLAHDSRTRATPRNAALSGIGSRRLWLTVLGWGVAILIFFPIFWMIVTSFKTEAEAIADPSLIFSPTIENYVEVQLRADYFKFAMNSVVVAFGSTLMALLLAIPAAYSMAFLPTKRTKGTLLWMLSTKMLPPVGVLVPIYLLFRDTGLLDTRTGLIIVYTLMNLPIVVWMLYTFFKDLPKDILEAGRMDGASTFQEVWHLLLPLTLPGIASTGLLSVILSWNEAFWSLNLTSSQAAPLTAYIASFSSPEGLFWAKLSAASTMAIAPILVFGWLTQKQMVRGLTFGAVK